MEFERTQVVFGDISTLASSSWLLKLPILDCKMFLRVLNNINWERKLFKKKYD